MAESIDYTQYPLTWDDMVGQTNAKRILQLTTQSARMRDERCTHLLLTSGTAGIGKTSMALLVAREIGGTRGLERMVTVNGKVNQAEARKIISAMDDGDVLFWDEIHMAVQGGKANAEWLLNFLQDGTMMGPVGAESMPKITVVGATTDAGRLPETILSRFKKVELIDYTPSEAALIAFQLAVKVFKTAHGLPLPSPANFEAIAAAAVRRPRMMKQLLEGVRDIAVVTMGSNLDRSTGEYDLNETLDLEGLDPDGLDRTARGYLVALMTDFQAGAGEKALADRLNEPGGLRSVEHVLMGKGLIAKTARGRMLTKDGMLRARQIIAAAKEAKAA